MRQMIKTETQRKRELHFLDETLMKAQVWLKEIKEELHLDSERDSHAILCAVLHAIRDRISINEAVQLGAQLPALIRGYFYEGWKPKTKPETVRNTQEFLNGIAERIGERRFSRVPDVLYLTKGILNFLCKKISQGEVNDIKSNLPEEISKLWPQNGKSKNEQKTDFHEPHEVPFWHQPESGTQD